MRGSECKTKQPQLRGEGGKERVLEKEGEREKERERKREREGEEVGKR